MKKIVIFAMAVVLGGCAPDRNATLLERLDEINSRLDEVQSENKTLTEQIGELRIQLHNAHCP